MAESANDTTDATSPRRSASMTPALRWVIVLFLIGLQAATFGPLSPLMAGWVGGLAVIPVVAAGWLLGLRAGLLAALVCFAANAYLFKVDNQLSWSDLALHTERLSSLCVLLLIAAAVGRLRDLGNDLDEEIAQREAAERERNAAVEEQRRQAEEHAQASAALNERIAGEISERERAIGALQHRVGMERLIANISTRFINLTPGDLPGEIDKSLEGIGKFAEVDRSYVFLFSRGGAAIERTQEWLAPGIEPQIEKPPGLSLASFQWLIGKILRREIVVIHRVADIPPEGKAAREQLEIEGTQSVVCVPLALGETAIGLLGFDLVRNERLWKEEELTLLQMVARIFVNALAREEAFEIIEHLGHQNELILNSAGDGICGLDLLGNITFANQTAGKMAAASIEELVDLPLDKFLIETRVGSRGETPLERMFRTSNAPKRAEAEFRPKSGQAFPVEYIAAPIREGENVVGGVVTFKDISERRATEAALLESQNRLTSIISNAPLVVWVTDREGTITLSEGKGLQALGLKPGQAVGTSAFDLYPGNPVIVDCVTRALAGETSEAVVNVGELYFDAIFEPILAADGSVVGSAGVGTNISERIRAEQALGEREERYRLIVEGQTEFIVRWLPDGTRTFVNEAYCRYFGQSADQLVGQSIFPAVAPEHRELVRQKIAGLTPENPATMYEHQVLLPDHEVRWHQWTDRGLFDESGALRELQSVGRDVTEQRRAEQCLRDQQERLGRMADALPQAIYIGAADLSRFDYVSRAYDTISGRSGASLCDRPEAWWSAIADEDRDRIRNERQQAAGNGERQFAYRIARPDGSIRSVVERVIELNGSQENAATIVGIVDDVTETQAAERSLRETSERLRSVIDCLGVASLGQDRGLRYTWAHSSKLPIAQDVIGKTNDDLFPPDPAALLTLAQQEVLQTGAPQQFELDWDEADGSSRHYAVSIDALRDAEGAIDGLTVVLSDVSRDRQRERQLTDVENRLDRLASYAAAVVWTANADLEITSVVGLTPETFEGDGHDPYLTLPRMLHLNDPQSPVSTAARKAVQQEAGVVVETWEDRVFQVHVEPASSQAGAGYQILGVALDVTKRLGAEQLAQKGERRLRELYETLPVMLQSTDRDGKLLSVSDCWLQTLGYESTEVVGRLWTEFLAEDSRVEVENIVSSALAETGSCRENSCCLETKEGRRIDALLWASAKRDELGQLVDAHMVLLEKPVSTIVEVPLPAEAPAAALPINEESSTTPPTDEAEPAEQAESLVAELTASTGDDPSIESRLAELESSTWAGNNPALDPTSTALPVDADSHGVDEWNRQSHSDVAAQSVEPLNDETSSESPASSAPETPASVENPAAQVSLEAAINPGLSDEGLSAEAEIPTDLPAGGGESSRAQDRPSGPSTDVEALTRDGEIHTQDREFGDNFASDEEDPDRPS